MSQLWNYRKQKLGLAEVNLGDSLGKGDMGSQPEVGYHSAAHASSLDLYELTA